MVRVIVHEGCLGEEVILRGICETGRFKLEVKVRELWMSRVVNQKSTSICNSVPNYELSRFFMLFHHSKSTVSVVNLEHRQVITLSIYLCLQHNGHDGGSFVAVEIGSKLLFFNFQNLKF